MSSATRRPPPFGADRAREALQLEWLTRLEGHRGRVVLAEGDDDRVRRAAVTLAGLGLRPVLVVGSREGAVPVQVPGVEVAHAPDLASGTAGAAVREAGRARGWSGDDVDTHSIDPTYLAAALVATGEADGAVSGATHATAHVIRAALSVIGLEAGSSTLSSMFLMLLADGRQVAFADCGVVPDPHADQLADIAVATAGTYGQLTGDDPAVALLSFSTLGSAEHREVDKVRAAVRRARLIAPELRLDGELQFDAAFVPSVADAKAPGSTVAGHANTFVFPNLTAGNCAYKIAERLAGARAFGPILQGLARPMNDLSRGCSTDDVVNAALISLVQGLARPELRDGRAVPQGAGASMMLGREHG